MFTTHESIQTTTYGGPRSTLARALRQQLLNAMARLPDSVLRAMFARHVRSGCIRLPVVRAVYTGCLRRHPIDLHYGTETSGFVEPVAPKGGAQFAGQLMPYMGSQPTIIRRALERRNGLRSRRSGSRRHLAKHTRRPTRCLRGPQSPHHDKGLPQRLP
ncbi:hypothetical protein ACLKMY_19175 [Paraburkholderia mimosarum]|uniref:hypothetical protein n=1 Tax=Paraburkholderia mimosarum TaxID=312026 RepID=UPI0039C04968